MSRDHTGRFGAEKVRYIISLLRYVELSRRLLEPCCNRIANIDIDNTAQMISPSVTQFPCRLALVVSLHEAGAQDVTRSLCGSIRPFWVLFSTLNVSLKHTMAPPAWLFHSSESSQHDFILDWQFKAVHFTKT